MHLHTSRWSSVDSGQCPTYYPRYKTFNQLPWPSSTSMDKWNFLIASHFCYGTMFYGEIALYMQCMHCLCGTKLYIHFLLWWCIVMYAILGFTIWSHIEGDPYPRKSPSDGAFISYLSYSKSPSQLGQKFGIVFLAIHTTYFVLWVQWDS